MLQEHFKLCENTDIRGIADGNERTLLYVLDGIMEDAIFEKGIGSQSSPSYR